MDESEVYLDGAQRVMALTKQTFGNLFNSYFLGAVTVIPTAALPSCIVVKTAGSFKVSATMTDDVTEQIMVHLLLNGLDGFGTPDDDNTIMRKLFTLVEGRDPTTGYFMPTSLMYALRNNLTLNSKIINNSVTTNYTVTPRTDQPSLVEGIITVTINERIIVPNRS